MSRLSKLAGEVPTDAYPALLKPAGTPPSWVFGPVWSVYTC